ncbi:MAG: hypothetical protein K2X45_02155, partial [Phreatobacter sp.]|nr:hypothetical protein [Phreatobacter sp.]
GLVVRQRLAEADPGNAQFQRDLSISWNKIGDLAVAAGDGKAAREAFEKGLAVRQRLAEADPGNAQFQRDLILSHVKLASCSDQPDDHYRAALAIVERLQAEGRIEPKDAWVISDLRQRLGATGGGLSWVRRLLKGMPRSR